MKVIEESDDPIENRDGIKNMGSVTSKVACLFGQPPSLLQLPSVTVKGKGLLW